MLEVITVIFLSHRTSADSTFHKLEEESKGMHGDCFFLELLIPGSQEDHTELHALITTYMSHKADQFSSYLKKVESIFKKIQDGFAYCLGIRNRNLRSCTNIADINICVC